MNEFEKEIAATFQAYRDTRTAHLYILHPPMRIAGFLGHAPCHVLAGKAPYDIAGFYYDGCGTSVGAELKQTAEHENRLPIVPPDSDGSGLQYHQLVGLVGLHKAGGVALLLWNNGGQIGVLRGPELATTLIGYEASLKAKQPARGSKSILWGLFRPIKTGVDGRPVWLPKSGCKHED